MQRVERQEKAVALVITLALLVIMTIVVLGFLVSMRTERQAAVAMSNAKRAETIAQDAVEHAMAILDNNIPQPVPLGTPAPSGISGTPQNWIVSPGLLTKMSGPAGSQPTYIPLSTNVVTDPHTPPTTPPTDPLTSVNLNRKSAVTGNYPIVPTGEVLRATWVNVLQDPSAPASVTNPIVGQYAFWMDDENAKINVNTAYGKPAAMRLFRTNPLDSATVDSNYDDVGFNALRSTDTTGAYVSHYPGDSTYPPSGAEANAVGTSKVNSSGEVQARLYPLWHPSAVNLDVLGNSLNRNALADWVFNGTYDSRIGYVPNFGPVYGGNYRPVSYPEQIMQFVASSDPNFYNNNKFNLTAYNRAPEFNVFGKPRMLLERRIRTKSTASLINDSTTNNVHMNDSDTVYWPANYVSGGELEFYQTPDLDPSGPSYFHGGENGGYQWGGTTLPGGALTKRADVSSVQIVADYLSGMLKRKDWPGMPARSFVDKWGGDDAAKREADQVAWNIAAMGNYAPGIEGISGNNTPDWPDGFSLNFTEATNPGTLDSYGNVSPTTTAVSAQAPIDSQWLDPNKVLRVGALSGKAIMPFTSKPYLNEAALLLTATPYINPATGAVDASKGYTLQVQMKIELYSGRRCPPGSFWSHFNLSFGLTHFIYTAADTNNTVAIQAASGVTGDGDAGAADIQQFKYPTNVTLTTSTNAANGKGAFVAHLAGAAQAGTAGYCHPADDTTLVIQSTTPMWVTNGAKLIDVATPPAPPALPIVPTGVPYFKGVVHFRALTRLALYADSGHVENTWEIVPVWDTVSSSKSAMKPPLGQNDSLAWDFYVDVGEAGSSKTGFTFTRSLEVADARLGGMTNDNQGHAIWQPQPNSTTDTTTDDNSTISKKNIATTNANVDLDNYAFLDCQNVFYRNSPRPSIGFFSCIPTGMQRGLTSQTFKFLPSTSSSDLPDWLILDLVAPAFADTAQPTPIPLSYRHSTMGQLNLNARLYPNYGVNRALPLQGLFKNMVPDASLATLVDNIIQRRLSGVDFEGVGASPGQYNYIGELCEVAGVADGSIPFNVNGTPTTATTQWQKEALIRNLANLLTVKSNTFKVYGMARAVQVKKKAGNSNYGAVENGDVVIVNGEKRFESVIERSVWPGVDGVPGNAHVASTGSYDKVSSSTTDPMPTPVPWAGITIPSGSTLTPNANWTVIDGPDPITNLRVAPYSSGPNWYNLQYSASTLKTALNPARAHMTYKPITFRYVTE